MKKRLWTYTSFSADLGYVFHVIFILYNCFIVLLQKGSSQGQTREGYSGCIPTSPRDNLRLSYITGTEQNNIKKIIMIK